MLQHILLSFFGAILSFQVFAYNRVIDCSSNINYNLKVSIMLEPGTATLYNCTDLPCSRQNPTKISQTAQLKYMDQKTKAFHYIVTSGDYPATQSMDLIFPTPENSHYQVAFDGDYSVYSCN